MSDEYPNLTKQEERAIDNQIEMLANAGFLTPGEAAKERRQMKEELNEEKSE